MIAIRGSSFGRLRRPAAVIALLATVGLVPRASGAPAAFDPSATPPADPVTAELAAVQCAFITSNPPEDYPPAGLPTTTSCAYVYNASTKSFINRGGTNTGAVGTLGLQGAPRAAQWVKIPAARAIAPTLINLGTYNATTGQPPPEVPPGTTNIFFYHPKVWFLSDDDASVGDMPPFRVRTLGFGSIPVEVTVQISQPREGSNVIPLSGNQAAASGRPPGQTTQVQSLYDAVVTGDVSVGLSDLRVDGKPLPFAGRCQTASFGRVDLVGKGYEAPSATASVVPPGKYNSSQGGVLSGTVDIPPFAGCRTATGDDLSTLLTNAVSGAGNPVTFTQSLSQKVCYAHPKRKPQDPNGGEASEDKAACIAAIAKFPIPAIPDTRPAPQQGP